MLDTLSAPSADTLHYLQFTSRHDRLECTRSGHAATIDEQAASTLPVLSVVLMCDVAASSGISLYRTDHELDYTLQQPAGHPHGGPETEVGAH